jgi:hypothetical protein
MQRKANVKWHVVCGGRAALRTANWLQQEAENSSSVTKNRERNKNLEDQELNVCLFYNQII